MQAHHFFFFLEIESAPPTEYKIINDKLIELLKKYGVSPYSLDLQLLTANFQAFYLKQPELGKELLYDALKLPINTREQAKVKMELADIMVYDEKFNQAKFN